MLDSFGREISYLRISVTDRCNLRCVYCMPPQGIKLLPHGEILSYEEIAAVARVAVGMGMRKIRLTGGEPLIRRDFPQLVSLLSEIDGLETLAMTSNGSLLAPLAAELKERGLVSVNVSLDSLDPQRYQALSRGGELSAVLAGIDAALAAGLSLKLNAVIMEDDPPGNLDALREFAAGLGVRIQTIAHYRLDLEKHDGGSYDRPPPCAACNRMRLLADGTLRPCLHSSSGIKVDFSNIKASLEAAVMAKPPCGLACSDLHVGQIGG